MFLVPHIILHQSRYS